MESSQLQIQEKAIFIGVSGYRSNTLQVNRGYEQNITFLAMILEYQFPR